MIQYKKNKIAPFNLFFLLFVSRVIIAFTVSSETLKSRYSLDLAYSTLAALAVTALIALPAAISAAKGKNITDNKILSALYSVYLIFTGAVNVAKFAAFSSAELNRSAQIAVLAGFMVLAGVYAASLGVEAISRFGSMVFAVTLLGFAGLLAEGASDFSYLNLFPVTQNSGNTVLMNILFSVCSTNEIVLFILLAPKVNGKTSAPFYCSMGTAYTVTALIIAFTVGVLGDTASIGAYPLFEVAQLSKFGSGERVEVIFTALWIFAAFLKTTLFIYCSANSLPLRKKGLRFIICGLIMYALSMFIVNSSTFAGKYEYYTYPAFAVFAFVLPLLYLIFGRKRNNIENNGDF